MPDGGMGESPVPGSGQLLQHTPTQGNQAVDHNLNELGSLPLYMTAANKHGSDGSNLSSICRSGCENVGFFDFPPRTDTKTPKFYTCWEG